MERGIIQLILAAILAVGAAVWLWYSPGFEPFLTTIAGIAAIFGADWWHHKNASVGRARSAIEHEIDEYERIRKQESAAVARSARMTGCVKRMIIQSDRINEFPVSDWLSDAREGRRLAVYVYLFNKTNPKYFTALVTQVCLHEKPPFNIYWGLQAIRQCQGEHNFTSDQAKLGELLRELSRRIHSKKEIRGAGPDILFLIQQIQAAAAGKSQPADEFVKGQTNCAATDLEVPSVVVLSAYYGIGHVLEDVTKKVQSCIHGGKLNVWANTVALGVADKSFGKKKELTISCSIHGNPPTTITIPEDRRLILP